MPMRILVTGGREFDDKELLFGILDRLHQERQVSLVIHGAAKGADNGAMWARSISS